jgi:hypothetical protein
MSELKVNKVTPRSGTTVTLGDSGDTITIPSGATIDLSSATQTGVGGTNTPAFSATLNGNQSISTATTTKVQFATELFDTDSAYDNVTNYRFTPAVVGKYYLFSELTLDDLNDGSNIQLILYKNGVSYKISRLESGNTEKQSCTLSFIDVANATDYYEIFVLQNTGVSRNLRSDYNNIFGAYRLIGV